MSKAPSPIEGGPPPVTPTPRKKSAIARLGGVVANFLSIIFRPITFVWKKVTFESRGEKKEVMLEIRNKFTSEQWLLPFLDKASLSELEFFNSALGTQPAVQQDAVNTAVIKKALLTLSVTGRARYTSKGKARAFAALRLLASMTSMLPGTLDSTQKKDLLIAFLTCEDADFSQLEENIRFLQERLRSGDTTPPDLLTGEEYEKAVEAFNFWPGTQDETVRNKIMQFYFMVCDKVFFRNTQILGTAIDALISPLNETDARQHSAVPRFALFPSTSLFNENVFSTLHSKDSDQPVGTLPEVQIQISQPNTLNSVHISLPLPANFTPEMTVGEFRREIALLRDESQSKNPTKYNEWIKNAESLFIETLSSFSPESVKVKPHDLSSSKAVLDVAAEQNTYRLTDASKTLALVPELSENPEIKACTTVAQETVTNLSTSHEGKTILPAYYSQQLIETVEATCTLSYKETKDRNNVPYARITMTISDPLGRSHERVTYRQRTDKTREDVMREYKESGFLERDLLLAKAEFMKRHGSATGVYLDKWTERCFSEGKLPAFLLQGIQNEVKPDGNPVTRRMTIGGTRVDLIVTAKVEEGKLTLKTTLEIVGLGLPPTEYTLTVSTIEGKTPEEVLRDNLSLAFTPLLKGNTQVDTCLTIPKETVEDLIRVVTPAEVYIPGYYSKEVFERVKAQCQLRSQEVEKEGAKSLIITALILDELGRAEATEITLPMEGKTREAVLQEFKERGSLEAFILSAKTAFIKKHGSAKETKWREYCFKKENRLSEELLGDIRKELASGKKTVERTIPYEKRRLKVAVTAEQINGKLQLITSVVWTGYAARKPATTREVTLEMAGKSIDEVLREKLGSQISQCMEELGYYQ